MDKEHYAKEGRPEKGEMCMKKFFKQRGKKLTAVATAFALLCTAGVLPENVRHASAAEGTTGSQIREQIPGENQTQVSAQTQEPDQASGEGLVLNKENFPDQVFRDYLRLRWEKYDTNEDGMLSDEELKSFTEFNAHATPVVDISAKIKSLRGIEKLKYLTEVDVYGNNIIGELDISGLSNLKSIHCDKNKITSIVLPEKSKLEELNCADNPITFLDLTEQKELKSLSCPNMPIKTLDLTNQTKLDYLNVSDCRLTSLILPDCEMQGQYCAGLGAYLKQDFVDFNDSAVFPDFDMERVQTMQLKQVGKEPEELSKDTLKEKKFQIKGLDLGDKITYTYNCAVNPKDTRDVEFVVHIGAADTEYPPAYGDGMYPPENKGYFAAYLMKTLGDIKLTEGWQWKEGTDTEKEMRIGRLTTAAAIYTGEDGYYYSSDRLCVDIAMWRMGCSHPSESFIHHDEKAPTLTEKGNIEYYECGDCGTCYTQPDDFSHALSTEEIELPILYLADDVESTVSWIGYGQKIDNLDIFQVRWNENSGEAAVRATSIEIENVIYRKDENADKKVITDNSGFYIEGIGETTEGHLYVDISKETPKKSLGGLSYDHGSDGNDFPKPGIYTLDLTVDVVPMSGENGRNEGQETDPEGEQETEQEVDQAQRQKISLRRTIIIEKQKDTPGMPDASMEVPYTTNVVGRISLEENWKWASGDSEKALAVGEAVTVTAEYTGPDADLYENTVQEVIITRLACDHPEDKLELRNRKDNVCENGYTGDYFCTQCKEIVRPGEMIPAHHDLTLVEAKAATDTMPGNMAYYVCGDCGKCFEDEGGTKETTKDKVKIPALGTPVPSVTPVPTSKATAEPSPTNHPAVTEVPVPTKEPVKTETPATKAPTKEPVKTETPATKAPTKEPVKTETPATKAPTKEPVKTETPATKVPTKEPVKTETPATKAPTKEPVQTGVPVTTAPTAFPTKEPVWTGVPVTTAPTEAPTLQPVTTEPAPAPLAPELPTPGQSMVPQSSQAPAPSAADTPAPTQTPQWTPMATSKLSQKKPARKGKLITDSKGNRYKVTSSNVKNPTVTFYSAKMTAKKVTMSKSVRIDGVRYCITAVRSRAFEGHRKVTSIRLGSKVNTIGDRAFRNCKKLEKLYIQSTNLKPEDIGERVFENVPRDLKIYVPEKKKDEYRKMFREKGLGKLISVNSI